MYITKTLTRGRWLERESDVGDLPSQFSDRVHHQGRPPEDTQLSPLHELCVDIISATDVIRRRMEWENGAWLTGQKVCEEMTAVVSFSSVAPRRLKTEVTIKCVVPLFLPLEVWWSIILPKFKKTCLSKLDNMLQYTLKISIPYFFHVVIISLTF